jgi:predicted ribosome quality control (RQC) complex YloA/Tae2 family protein
LVFEQFAGGNMFLLDTGGKIVRPYHFKQSEKKRYTAGQQYQYPASEPFQLPADMAGWRAKAAEKPNATLSALLARWPVGKCYTNEVLTRLGWKEKKAGEVSETEAGLLRTELEKVMNHPSFCVYEDEQGHMLEVSLTTLHAQALAAAKTFPTFSEAVEYYFSQAKAIEAPHESPELVKMRKRLSEQEGALEKLEGELAQGGPQTAWIEENLAGLEERREKINAGKKGGEKVEKHRWWIESG